MPAKYQYFDSRGMFISVMMSTPLLLAAAFVAANWFKLSFELMTEVKIMQIKRQQVCSIPHQSEISLYIVHGFHWLKNKLFQFQSYGAHQAK